MFIQSLGNAQVFVSLINPITDTKVNVIYDLSSLSLHSVYYSAINTKATTMPSFFHLGFSNPIVIFIEKKNEAEPKAYQISKLPMMLLTVGEMIDEGFSQHMVLNLMNDV
jgi:hypothetical protein